MFAKIGLVVVAVSIASIAACSGDDSNGATGSPGQDGGGGGGGDGGTSGGDGGKGNTDGGGGGGTSPPLPPDAGATSCTIFPADNPWNTDISDTGKFPADPHSSDYMTFIGNNGSANVHPDFGSDPSYGFPYIFVPGTEPKVAVTFDQPDESDPSPYPIPLTAPIESDSDAHVIAIDKDNCKLYEMDGASAGASSWSAYSGALFDLTSNALRPDQWTSGDAAGLPIFAGLVRKYEVDAGAIHHALRVTLAVTAAKFVHPATHSAGNSAGATYAPPMGARFRLKASYDTSGFTGQSKVIVAAFKQYGLFLADNSGAGNNWFVSGETNTNWNDDDLNQLKNIPGDQFEVLTIGTTIAGDGT